MTAVSFDGATTRSYSQALAAERGRGLVVGFEETTPLDDMPNYYEQLLFLQLNLVNNATPIPPSLRSLTWTECISLRHISVNGG